MAEELLVTRRYESKTVLLTGGLGSLGRAQAAAFVAEGADLLLLDMPGHADAASIVAELATTGSGSVRLVEQDLLNLEEAQRKVRGLADERDGIDVLINNAALILNRPFEDFAIADYEDQMRVNAGAAFALTQAVAPGMRARRSGAIVNFCSVTLSGEWDGYVPYVASKGAMLGLTKSLARELGPDGIRVNAVSPGAVVSDAEARIFGDRAEEYQAWVLRRQSLKARILPADIAAAVLFLASDAARMISGQILNIDGGW